MSEKQVDVSEKGLLDLAESVINALEAMNKYNEELSDELNSLGKTFRDEGYNIVKNYVTNARNIIAENTPHAVRVAEALVDYAHLVHESKKVIPQN